MRSIQVIKATGNPADVAASLWKTYINGGLTSQFLTDLLRLKKSSTNISGRPSSEFQSFVQGGLQQLLNEKEIKDVSEKILLGCLTAIKGVHFKSQASYAVEDLILASADIVTRSLCNLTESQRVIVSRALNSLLSNKQPVAVLERLFQQELFHSRLDHDVTSPYPFVRERIGNRMSSNQGNSGKKGKSGKFQQRDLSPSFTEPSSENNFKIVSLLTFKSYESFPFLMKLPVADDVWKAYIKDLKDAGHRLCVVNVVRVYPDRATVDDLQWLENALIANENWEDYANLLGFIHHVRVNVKEKIQFKLEQNVGKDQGESVEARSGTHKRNVSGLTNGKGYADSKMALKVTDAILLRDGRPLSEILNSLQTTDHFLLTLSNADFLLHMERFMGICLEADSTLSLRAAGILVKEFSGMCSVTEDQIKTISWKKKFRTYVIKDKWLLAAQMTNTLPSKICLYEMLVDNGKYMEAREFTATYNLAAHVSPVSDALVEEQDRQLKATYLQFPSHAAKIVVVDSVETVTYMAQVLGFTLQKQSSSTSCASSSAEPFDINDAASQEANEKFHHTKLRLRDVLQAISQNRFNIAVSAEMEVVGKTDSNATTEITANATVFSSIPPLVSSNVSNKSRSGNTFRNVIGLDAEWKVEMYTNSSDCGAGVLQIATSDHVFLLDLYTIGNVHDSKFDNKEVLALSVDLIQQIFSDKSLLKLAFDFYLEDLKMIRRAGKGAFMNSVQSIESLIDIQSETKDGESYFNLSPIAEGVSTKNVSSLSETCQRYLGKPLLKTSQLSDWKHRPLSPAQMFYASLDAHCLIGVLDALLLEKNVDSGMNVALAQYQIHDILEQNKTKVQQIINASSSKKAPQRNNKKTKVEG